MSKRKSWEWVVCENVDEWGDSDNLAFFDDNELRLALAYMCENDELQLYLKILDRHGEVIDADYALVDLENKTLPDYMDYGSSIPKFLRKQLGAK